MTGTHRGVEYESNRQLRRRLAGWIGWPLSLLVAFAVTATVLRPPPSANGEPVPGVTAPPSRHAAPPTPGVDEPAPVEPSTIRRRRPSPAPSPTTVVDAARAAVPQPSSHPAATPKPPAASPPAPSTQPAPEPTPAATQPPVLLKICILNLCL